MLKGIVKVFSLLIKTCKGVIIRLHNYFSVLLYYLGYLIPRCRKKWVFGGGANSKYFFFEIQEKKYFAIKTYLILRNKDEVIRLNSGYSNVLYVYSLKGIFHMLTSAIFFCTVDLGELCFILSGGSKVVNLWHGVGIKKMGAINNIEHEDKALKIKSFKRWFNLGYLSLRPYIFLSTSPMMNKHFANCFRICQDQFVEALYPRCKFMLQNRADIYRHLEKIHDENALCLIDKIKRYKKCFLYMPTWRDSGADVIENGGFDFAQLNKLLLDKSFIFLLKMHPNTNLDISSLSECSNIIYLDKNLDLYPILPFTSMLITDYSSIYYDYLLMPEKEVLLFPYDEKEYLAECRDFAFDYKMFTPGRRAYTFDELVYIISNDVSCIIEQRDFILNSFWGKRFDLYEKIVNKLLC